MGIRATDSFCALSALKLTRGDSLMNHVDSVLRDGVKGSDRLRTRLIGLLRDDQVGELGRNIHVRLFQCFVLDRSQAAGTGYSNAGRTGSERRLIVIAAQNLQPLSISHIRQRQLTDRRGLTIAELSGNQPIRSNIEAGVLSAGKAVLV